MMFAGEDGLVEDVMENSLASDKEKTEVVRGILAEVCYWPALQIQIIAKFLDPKEDLYKDIEGPLSVLARACVAQGVEAIVESWVSVLENHSSSVRGITDQDRLEDEVWVAINGPEVVHCEGIVREAIRVGEGGGHFIRRGGNIKSYGVSKAVDSLVKKPPKVPFML